MKLDLFSRCMIIMWALCFMIGIIGNSRHTKYRIVICKFSQILSSLCEGSFSFNSFYLFFTHYFINIFNIKFNRRDQKIPVGLIFRVTLKKYLQKGLLQSVLAYILWKKKVQEVSFYTTPQYFKQWESQHIFYKYLNKQIQMAHVDCTKPEQIQAFLDANGGIAVVDCHATWCPPCKAIAPYVHKKNEETKIPLVKIDVDQAPEVSQAYKIQAMPTFLVIKGKWNNIVETVVGGGQANVDKMFASAAKHK